MSDSTEQQSNRDDYPSPKRLKLELPDLPDYTDDNLDTLFTKKMDLHYTYLTLVTNLNYRRPIIVTSKIRDLIELWKMQPRISIEGPKGCGKTVLCATLYQMLADKVNFDHVFLTYRSLEFDIPECRTYFNDFFASHEDLFKQKLSISGSSSDYLNAMEMLSVVSRHKPLRVFIDLSSLFVALEGRDLHHFMNMVGMLSSYSNHRVLISVSSGIKHVTNCRKEIREKLDNLLNECHQFYVTGFTEKEAKKYFTNDRVSFEEVYPFTGTNPYLLTSVNKVALISEVEQIVSWRVQKYMSTNLELEKNSDKLVDYFKTQDLRDTTKFSYRACRRGQLDETEEREYQQTWLARHCLAVVEDVRAKILTVEADQDETLTNKQEGSEVGRRILRWNFPTFGSMYLDVLRNFIDDCNSAKLKEICKKEPSFAGFWLEGMFVSHHHKTSAALSVECIEQSSHGTKENIIFENFSVAMLHLSFTEVQPDVLYELKRAHPIVDFVGHLTDQYNSTWLVFIQISLQSYQRHRTKLGDMFRRTSENVTNKSWSLYTQYRHLYSIDYSDQSTKVLLLYISPIETNLKQLQSSVMDIHINQSVYVGVLASTATFYKDLIEFNKLVSF